MHVESIETALIHPQNSMFVLPLLSVSCKLRNERIYEKEFCMLSSGKFPSVWILYANVSEHSVCSIFIPACEDGTDRVRNVGIYNSDAEELPRRKPTTFRTRRKFEIKKMKSVWQTTTDRFVAVPSVACIAVQFTVITHCFMQYWQKISWRNEYTQPLFYVLVVFLKEWA
jgi:hypothetical protein